MRPAKTQISLRICPFSCNNVATTGFGSWSELQCDAISANDAKQKFGRKTKIHTKIKNVYKKPTSWEIWCFSGVFQESNTLKRILSLETHIFRVWYVLMHLQRVVLVCDVSMVTENVWNRIFTMKSTRTSSYHNTLKFLYFICLTYW